MGDFFWTAPAAVDRNQKCTECKEKLAVNYNEELKVYFCSTCYFNYSWLSCKDW